MSGRGEEYRRETEQWLHDNSFHDYYVLLMRGFGDRRDDAIVKQELYEKYVQPFFTVRVVLDDRDRVVHMWRSLGLTCFQVAPGNF